MSKVTFATHSMLSDASSLMSFESIMDSANEILWGPIMILALVGTGLYLTIRLRFVQLLQFKHSLRCVSGRYDNPEETGDITHFQALCSALSATIGTGNIAGVATAIALGGPGAVFWMWVTAVVGMATKFTSCSLALKYRVVHEDGSTSGGPMYFLDQGLNLRFLGRAFALFAALAAFGAGCMVQSNSVADGLGMILPQNWQIAKIGSEIPFIGGTLIFKISIGVILSVMVGVVIIGGIKRIAKVASKIVPLMCVIYVGGALVILVKNAGAVPSAFVEIFQYAFTPFAAGAGFLGAVLARTIQKGVARGVFSNESGLGSAPIAHAAAKTSEPVREGMVAMLGPFIDTILICTMTALVIITTGSWHVRSDEGELLYGPGAAGLPMKIMLDGTGVQVIGPVGDDPVPYRDKEGQPYLMPTGASLTVNAFESQLPSIGKWIVAIGLIFFAYSTMIAWSYYGDRSCEYLFGSWSVVPYRYVFCFFVILGTVGGLDLIWVIADNLNALMAVPNLIALIVLSPWVVKETVSYLRRMREAEEV